MCHKILAAIKEIFIIEDNYISISVSIGAAIYPTGGDRSDIMIRNADIAMYQVKKKGRNDYQIYDHEIATRYDRYLRLKTSLSRSVEDNELSLCYQPIVNFSTEAITGVETLMRWQHPEFGFINPEEFIDIAEEAGEIHKIGYWLLDSAFKDLEHINNFVDCIESFSVNISPLQLVPKGFVNELVNYDVIIR